jgi:predicted nucleotide-binding protein (sugar kinase/HSP70/actin superfamily)
VRIGIPNTLFAAYHLPYWRHFLMECGAEVVLSPPSESAMADRGGKLIPPEFCIPIKIFMGHILSLLEQGVDLILVPRMNSRVKDNFFCPKFIGLPEIVKYAIRETDGRLLIPEVSCNGSHIRMLQLPGQPLAPPGRMRRAEQRANAAWEQLLARCRRERLILPEACRESRPAPGAAQLRIGLLGYAYNLYDPWISKGIPAKLTGLGASVLTWEMLPTDRIERGLRALRRPVYWNFGRTLLGTGLHFLAAPELDGIVYVSTFGCGPDSVVLKWLSLEAAERQKPFLSLSLDEHAEDSHLQTRLEAFCDMLSAKKEEHAV